MKSTTHEKCGSHTSDLYGTGPRPMPVPDRPGNQDGPDLYTFRAGKGLIFTMSAPFRAMPGQTSFFVVVEPELDGFFSRSAWVEISKSHIKLKFQLDTPNPHENHYRPACSVQTSKFISLCPC